MERSTFISDYKMKTFHLKFTGKNDVHGLFDSLYKLSGKSFDSLPCIRARALRMLHETDSIMQHIFEHCKKLKLMGNILTSKRMFKFRYVEHLILQMKFEQCTIIKFLHLKRWKVLKFTVNLHSALVIMLTRLLPYITGSTNSKLAEFRSRMIRDHEDRIQMILISQSWNDCLKFHSLHCGHWVRTCTFQELWSGSTWLSPLVFNIAISNESHTCAWRSFGWNESMMPSTSQGPEDIVAYWFLWCYHWGWELDLLEYKLKFNMDWSGRNDPTRLIFNESHAHSVLKHQRSFLINWLSLG
jgi:hypothetical protein